MSIYKDPRSPYYWYDFKLRNRRFFGSTKATSKRAAEAVERAEREKARALVAQQEASSLSLSLDDVAGRYWSEIGQHHAAAANTWRLIERLIEFFGRDKLITEITGDDVARLVAWRRGHRVERGGKRGALISPFTVNDTTEQLKKLFTRANTWGVRFDRKPCWREHWLREPQERVRELMDDEANRLEAATRDDYAPFFAFAKASGLRLAECLLKWSEVDWDNRRISKQGKGGNRVTAPITSEVRAILWPRQGAAPSGHLSGREDRVAAPAGRRRRRGLPLPRLPPQSRNETTARDREPKAGSAGAQPCGPEDNGPLRARP
jgi:integrase